ncbi:MAG: nitroreductase family protein [Zestosphaera sp.]
MQVILTRRSVRKYKDVDVPDDVLMKILEAGRWAPSGEDAQPWRFIVVKDKAKRELLGRWGATGSGRRFKSEYMTRALFQRIQISDEEKRKRVYRKLITGEVSAFMKDAPVLIVVVGRRNVWDAPYDVSAAIENMLLAAHALGLGACWLVAPVIDVRDELKVKELLKIPEEYTLDAIIALGYPDEQPKPRPRLPLEEITFYEEFGRKFPFGGKVGGGS